MHVFVDSLIYQLNSSGGIARAFSELLPRACDRAPGMQVSMLVSGKLRRRPPAHSRILVQRTFPIDNLLLPSNYWWRTRIGAELRGLMQKKHLSNNNRSIWHSTYYTLAPRPLPSVVTVHDMIYERMPDSFDSSAAHAFRDHKKRSIQSADVITTVSRFTKQDLQELFQLPDDRIRVVPNGVAPSFTPLPEQDYAHLRGQKPFLLYVGGRSSYKNFWNFIEAFRAWRCSSEIDIVAVGTRWKSHERKRISQFGLGKQVILLSHVDDERLNRLMNAALALVHPSLYEGFGLPVLEAMAAGCPVVANRIPVLLEIAGEIPYYFDSDSRESLYSALDAAVSGGRQAERIRCGLEAAQRYSWDSAASEMLDVYRGLV